MPRLGWNWVWIFYALLSILTISVISLSTEFTYKDIQATGRVLFRALRDSECKVNCTNTRRRPVCGSDGVTYPSRCELKRIKRCEGRNIRIKKKGKCSASSVAMSKCFKEREEAQAVARLPTVGVFIPACKKNGTFAEAQCHAATGYCWCVTSEGKPVPGTSVSGKKPRCRGKSKRRNRKKNGEGKKSRKGCSQMDRSTFNNNLINEFTSEFDRGMSTMVTPIPPRYAGNDPAFNTHEKHVVEWKFTQLDKDRDNFLKRKEVRSLRRMVKNHIKPKACAKSFVKYCDLDQNRTIARSEWSLCLGVDINNEQATPHPPDSSHREEEPQLPFNPGRWKPVLTPRRPSTPQPKQEKENNVRSCLDEHVVAVRHDIEDPTGRIFIPACTDTGNWAKAQCHKSTQYCWCVDEKTGHPIAGTSTHKVQPNCDFQDEREMKGMKGCPYAIKRQFLADLMEQLIQEMNENKLNGTNSHNFRPSDTNTDWSREERAVRWKLQIMDLNGNGVMERKELKEFKKNIKSQRHKYTRKCSRNFIRYCDENSDNKVTLDEWISCTGIHQNYVSSLPVNPKRKGKNPFMYQLYPAGK